MVVECGSALEVDAMLRELDDGQAVHQIAGGLNTKAGPGIGQGHAIYRDDPIAEDVGPPREVVEWW